MMRSIYKICYRLPASIPDPLVCVTERKGGPAHRGREPAAVGTGPRAQRSVTSPPSAGCLHNKILQMILISH